MSDHSGEGLCGFGFPDLRSEGLTIGLGDALAIYSVNPTEPGHGSGVGLHIGIGIEVIRMELFPPRGGIEADTGEEVGGRIIPFDPLRSLIYDCKVIAPDPFPNLL
jgi:hypothetical protein